MSLKQTACSSVLSLTSVLWFEFIKILGMKLYEILSRGGKIAFSLTLGLFSQKMKKNFTKVMTTWGPSSSPSLERTGLHPHSHEQSLTQAWGSLAASIKAVHLLSSPFLSLPALVNSSRQVFPAVLAQKAPPLWGMSSVPRPCLCHPYFSWIPWPE